LWGNGVAGCGKGFANRENAVAELGEGVAGCGNGVVVRRIGFAPIS
jgi:hypothetical protein